MLKKLLLLLAVVLAGIQFLRPTISRSFEPQPRDLFAVHAAPAQVQQRIQESCYDCHSVATRTPWYAQVQPVRWWLVSHVNDGRKHLNFSEFGAYPAKRAARKLEESVEEIEEGEMPLRSYTWAHPEARLSPEDKRMITDWLKATREKIRASGS